MKLSTFVQTTGENRTLLFFHHSPSAKGVCNRMDEAFFGFLEIIMSIDLRGKYEYGRASYAYVFHSKLIKHNSHHWMDPRRTPCKCKVLLMKKRQFGVMHGNRQRCRNILDHLSCEMWEKKLLSFIFTWHFYLVSGHERGIIMQYAFDVECESKSSVDPKRMATERMRRRKKWHR